MLTALSDAVEHFRGRVLLDALADALAATWHRRAAVFEAAAPRPGDFPGRATADELAEAGRRCRATASACRHRAQVALLDDEPDLFALVREVLG